MNKIFITIVMMVFCCGCVVPSINPFYTNDVVIQLPQLMGSWDLVSNGSQQYKPKQVKSWVIDKEKIATFDEHGLSGQFSYKVFKIDNEIFLDVVPLSEDVNQFWLMSVFPVHLSLRLNIEGDQLISTPLNYEWVEAKQKSGQLTLPMVKPTDGQWTVYNVKSQEWV